MIKRDSFDIICQHSTTDPNYLDGGDSARAVGLSNLVTGKEYSLFNFVSPSGLCVRHPFQYPHNDPRTFTRDQLLPLMAGLSKSMFFSKLNRLIFKAFAKRLFFGQNTHDQRGNKKPWWRSRDPLHPGHIGFMIQASKLYLLYPLLIVCWPFLLLEMLFGVYIKPKQESNQLLSMLIVSGDVWVKMYCKLLPSWREPLLEYWGGWRDQKEMADNIIKYVEGKL